MRTLGALFLMLSLAALPVLAQETRGNISGTVQDATGVIPGASVKVTNVDTGVSRTLTTNERGFYNAPLLNAGNYQVSVEMAGYKTLTRSGVTLSVGQQLSINLALEVGAITEQLTRRDDLSSCRPETYAVEHGRLAEDRLAAWCAGGVDAAAWNSLSAGSLCLTHTSRFTASCGLTSRDCARAGFSQRSPT